MPSHIQIDPLDEFTKLEDRNAYLQGSNDSAHDLLSYGFDVSDLVAAGRLRDPMPGMLADEKAREEEPPLSEEETDQLLTRFSELWGVTLEDSDGDSTSD